MSRSFSYSASSSLEKDRKSSPLPFASLLNTTSTMKETNHQSIEFKRLTLQDSALLEEALQKIFGELLSSDRYLQPSKKFIALEEEEIDRFGTNVSAMIDFFRVIKEHPQWLLMNGSLTSVFLKLASRFLETLGDPKHSLSNPDLVFEVARMLHKAQSAVLGKNVAEVENLYSKADKLLSDLLTSMPTDMLVEIWLKKVDSELNQDIVAIKMLEIFRIREDELISKFKPEILVKIANKCKANHNSFKPTHKTNFDPKVLEFIDRLTKVVIANSNS